VDRLTLLGLDAQEAAVYVHLSMMGPSKASDIAAALKLHRTETYRTLQTLVQRGFASSTLSRPARFEAAPPERLFEEILAAQQARSENIQRAQQEIAPALSTLRGQTAQATSRNTFKVLQGRREIYAVQERMVREAQHSIRVLSTHEGAVSMHDTAGILDSMAQRAVEGVAVRAVYRTTPPSRARLAELPPGVEVRHLETGQVMRLTVVDESSLLLWVVSDPSSRLTSEEDVAIWTDAADFVGTQTVLFDAVWRTAPDVRSMAVAEGIYAPDRTGVTR
jgi:HTH-type transcriptional regulator, sugar sensing transcriptional regulator